MDTNLSLVCVGIDIAKDKFDACLVPALGKRKLKEFTNTPDGFAKLLRWAGHLAPSSAFHFCMEATGSYYEALASYLADANQLVSIINPSCIHHAARAQGAGNKTDRADAGVIADFCRKESPPIWRRSAPEVRTLVAMMRRLHSLKDLLNQEQNRLADPGLTNQPEVLASLNKSVGFLKGEIDRLLAQVNDHIEKHPGLRADRELLTSIPGIGELTAAWIIAELPDVRMIGSAQSAAAYAGLAPREYSSGTSVHHRTHLSKRGNVYLRRAMYMPAMAAARYNPAVKALYDRLIAEGRPRMVAIGAAMRKLLMLAYGVLRSRKEFQYTPAQS
jgi:transposase